MNDELLIFQQMFIKLCKNLLLMKSSEILDNSSYIFVIIVNLAKLPSLTYADKKYIF